MLHAHAIHLKRHVTRMRVARITCYPPRNTSVHGLAIRVQVHVIHVHHTYHVTSHVIRVIITYYVWWPRITCDWHVVRVAITYYVFSACITWCMTRYRSSGPKTRITCVLTCLTCGAELLMTVLKSKPLPRASLCQTWKKTDTSEDRLDHPNGWTVVDTTSMYSK